MRKAVIWTLAIATGGILLGAVLGSAADPDMKDSPEPWWQQAAEDSERDPAYAFAETDTGMSRPFGGFRPDLDYDTEVWSLPLPDYELAPTTGEPVVPDETPEARHPTLAADRAADEAEAAADEAISAAMPEPTPVDVRKSELAQAGLY